MSATKRDLKKLSGMLKNRIDIVFFWEVVDGLGNGDPDFGNNPRIDPETGNGLATSVCVKRKIRNTVPLVANGDGFSIFISGSDSPIEDRILNNKMEAAYAKLGIEPGSPDAIEKVRDFMCQIYWDVRSVGAVMSTGKNKNNGEDEEEAAVAKPKTKENGPKKEKRYSAGKITGPLQISEARTIDPICIIDQCITRACVASQDDANKHLEKYNEIMGTMGRNPIMAYGLFRQKAWINSYLAAKTNFSQDDFKVFMKSLAICFGNERTSSKGHQSFRGAYVFVHDSQLGSAHDYELFDAVSVEKKVENPRSFADYKIEVLKDKIPSSVKLYVITHASDVDEINLD